MVYIFMIFMFCCGYYALTYGVSLWKNDENRLGAIFMIFLSVFGTIIPAYVMFINA